MENWANKQKDYWDSISGEYDSLYGDTWSRLENSQVLGQLMNIPALQTANRVLDVGCGTGLGYELCEQVINKPFEYVGIDISPEMVNICKKKWI